MDRRNARQLTTAENMPNLASKKELPAASMIDSPIGVIALSHR